MLQQNHSLYVFCSCVLYLLLCSFLFLSHIFFSDKHIIFKNHRNGRNYFIDVLEKAGKFRVRGHCHRVTVSIASYRVTKRAEEKSNLGLKIVDQVIIRAEIHYLYEYVCFTLSSSLLGLIQKTIVKC